MEERSEHLSLLNKEVISMKETFHIILCRALATTLILVATIIPATATGNATITKMPTLGGTYGAMVYGMNAAGQLTGFSYRPGNTSVHAFLYDGGAAMDLGTLGGVVSQGFAINATGQIAGEANLPGDSATHAVLFSGGMVLDLGTLGGSFSSATAINAGGEMAGRSFTAGDQTMEAFLYSDGTMVSLGTLGGSYSTAVAMNDSGAVAGDSETADFEVHAFLHADGTMIDLGTLGGSYSSARALNNAGMVVGESVLDNGQTHGFLHANGIMTDLGTFGGDYSTAYGLNELGQVIGAATTASGEWRGFIYENGALTDLETLGGDYTDPFAINNLGHVVGHSVTDTGSLHAFLWRNGTIVDLNDLLPSDSGWELISAQFINDSGRIVGFGIFEENFEWFILQLPTGGNQPPVAMAGPDQTTECSEPVTLDGSLSSDPDGDPLTFEWRLNGNIVANEAQFTAYFLPGTHILTLTVVDSHGASAQDEVLVTSVDTTPPDISSVTASPEVLTPPNNKLIPVAIAVVATDTCDSAPVSQIISITANAPVAPGDITITGALTATLAAKKNPGGNERIYTITVSCTDASGNSSTDTVTVEVPQKAGGGQGNAKGKAE